MSVDHDIDLARPAPLPEVTAALSRFLHQSSASCWARFELPAVTATGLLQDEGACSPALAIIALAEGYSVRVIRRFPWPRVRLGVNEPRSVLVRARYAAEDPGRLVVVDEDHDSP